MIERVDFEPFHAREVFPRVFLHEDYLPEEHLQFMWQHGMAWSLKNPRTEKYVAFGGILPMWEGVGELYSFITEEVKEQYPIQLHKTAKKFIQEVQSKFGFHRIQCIVAKHDPIGYKWAKSLGFKDEGVMERYTPDKTTVIRFARVW
jgi:hypothetical protein